MIWVHIFLAFFINIHNPVDNNGSFLLQKCCQKSNTIAAFLNPYVIFFSDINHLINFPNISVKTGDNLINFMTNFVSKLQLVTITISKLLKVSTNFMYEQISLLSIR